MKEIFPPDDSVAIILIGFMSAFNDLHAVFECYKRHADDFRNKVDQEINLAKRCYFFRLTCGHLYEVLKIFKSLENDANVKKLINNIEKIGKEAYGNLSAIPTGFHNSICRIRHNASFHYPNKKEIKKAIINFTSIEESSIISSKTYGGTRFMVADDVMNFIVDSSLEEIPADMDMEKMIQQVADAQGQLFRLIDCLFVAYLKDRKLFSRIKVEEDV